jgi:O-antigen/teichoic acid export membrane protein
MKGTSAALVGVMSGLVGGVSLSDAELAATFSSIAASAIVVIATLFVYLYREWQAKLAITPLFVGALIYLNYAFFITPLQTADYLCQIIDSIGIIAIISYTVWNRRKPCEKSEKASTKEKDHPTQEMRVITK